MADTSEHLSSCPILHVGRYLVRSQLELLQ